MDTSLTTADLAPVFAGAGSGVRVVRDHSTGAIAIVLDAAAADALDYYLDGLGAFHDIAGDGADDGRLAAADVISTIRGLMRA